MHSFLLATPFEMTGKHWSPAARQCRAAALQDDFRSGKIRLRLKQKPEFSAGIGIVVSRGAVKPSGDHAVRALRLQSSPICEKHIHERRSQGGVVTRLASIARGVATQ
jgi:hypothetical protein